MEKVEVNLDGVKSIGNFEAIEIVDEIDSFLALLRLDWAFDNSSILNLKNKKMQFD